MVYVLSINIKPLLYISASNDQREMASNALEKLMHFFTCWKKKKGLSLHAFPQILSTLDPATDILHSPLIFNNWCRFKELYIKEN